MYLVQRSYHQYPVAITVDRGKETLIALVYRVMAVYFLVKDNTSLMQSNEVPYDCMY